MAWVIVGGLVIAASTLGVIAWATPQFGEQTARTMGFVVFSLTNIWFALGTADEERSIFNSDALPNPTLLKVAGAALLATLLGTELNFFHRLLDTVSLDLNQWAISFVASLAVLVLAEGRKALGIRTLEPTRTVAVAVPVPAT
jgi:Ca2+-transporting ATPase